MKQALISIDTIKAKSYMHDNINDEKLLVLLERVQDTYTQDLLGSEFYNYLQDNYSTLNATEKAFIEQYLTPCMLIMLEIKALYEFSIDIRNLGAGSVVDSTFSPLTGEDIRIHENNKRKELVVMEQLLRDYLMRNASSFPHWVNNTGLNIKTKSNFNISAL
jgi:hypothetical protein